MVRLGKSKIQNPKSKIPTQDRKDWQLALRRLEQEKKQLLKTYRGVIHEDASSETKYVRLKILENQIAHLKEALLQQTIRKEKRAV